MREPAAAPKGLRHNFCSAFLILFNNIDQPSVLRKECISNPTYGLSYYNTLAALWKRCQDKSETTNVVMHALDSAALALTNMSNSDTHIVKLRENMARAKINLFLASKNEWTNLLTKILRPSVPADQEVIKYLWPDVALRKLGNIRRGALAVLRKQRLASQLTKTMKHLCPLTEPWTLLALDQIANKTILMLTGLVSNQKRLLVRGELAPQDTRYPGCKCARDPETDTTSTLIHRMTICPYFNRAPEIAKAKEIIKGTDKPGPKTEILRQLTNLAIQKKNTETNWLAT